MLAGRVVNVTDFGLFIDIYNGLEGLAHISEIEVGQGSKLEDHYQVGDWVRARILRIEEDDKKVGLSMRGVGQPSEEEIAELNDAAAAKRGLGAAPARPGGRRCDDGRRRAGRRRAGRGRAGRGGAGAGGGGRGVAVVDGGGRPGRVARRPAAPHRERDGR